MEHTTCSLPLLTAFQQRLPPNRVTRFSFSPFLLSPSTFLIPPSYPVLNFHLPSLPRVTLSPLRPRPLPRLQPVTRHFLTASA